MDGSSFDRRDPAPNTGLVVGTFVGLSDLGASVAFDMADGPRISVAVSLVMLRDEDVGRSVVLSFENGAPTRPVILGCLQPPAAAAPPAAEILVDGDRVEIAAEREIVLRCGKASITLTRSGKIVLRGTYILSRSSGPNKIKGGSIQLN